MTAQKTWNVIDTEANTPWICYSFSSQEEYDENFPNGILMDGFKLEVIEGRKMFETWTQAHRWACMCLQGDLTDQVCLSTETYNALTIKCYYANFGSYRPNTLPMAVIKKDSCRAEGCNNQVFIQYHSSGSHSGQKCNRCLEKALAQ